MPPHSRWPPKSAVRIPPEKGTTLKTRSTQRRPRKSSPGVLLSKSRFFFQILREMILSLNKKMMQIYYYNSCEHFTPVCCHRPFALISCMSSPQNLVVTASNALTSALTEHPGMDVSLGEKKTRSRWDKLVYLWEFLVWDLIYMHLMHIWGREERLKVCMFFVYCRLSMFSLVVIT